MIQERLPCLPKEGGEIKRGSIVKIIGGKDEDCCLHRLAHRL